MNEIKKLHCIYKIRITSPLIHSNKHPKQKESPKTPFNQLPQPIK